MELKEQLKTPAFKEEIYTIAEEIVEEVRGYTISEILDGCIDVKGIQKIILDGLEQLVKETNSF